VAYESLERTGAYRNRIFKRNCRLCDKPIAF